MQREAELAGDARGAQQAHGVLAIARLGIADQPQLALPDIGDTTHVIPDREIGDVVVERVRTEVTAPYILVDGAVEIVAQDAARIVAGAMIARVRIGDGFGGIIFAQILVVDFRRRGRGAKGRHLDDLIAIHDVRETKTPADQPAVAEQATDFLGTRVGRDIEVLR